MDPTSILPPIPTAAPRGASDLSPGPASSPARPASGSGFAVKSFDALFGGSSAGGRSVADEIALKNVKVELDIDKSLNRVVATVRDPETGEVLNQFPAETVLNNARAIRDLLAKQLDIEV